MTAFDQETALTRRDDHHWDGRVHAAYNIGDNPNGGYLAAIAMGALQQLMPMHPDPLSLTVQYLRPGSPDENCEIDARVIRSGRTITSATATLNQGGRPRIEAFAAMGNLGGGVGEKPVLTIAPPVVPPPEDCISRPSNKQGIHMAILDRLDIRLHPDYAIATMAEGDVSETRDTPASLAKVSHEAVERAAQVSGWIRFRDGREPDSRACLLFADAFPPPIFGLLGMVGWVPTIELTVHVRRRPSPGWMLAHFTTHDLTGGRLIEDGLLWDQEGHLVAQSRQLALLPTAGMR